MFEVLKELLVTDDSVRLMAVDPSFASSAGDQMLDGSVTSQVVDGVGIVKAEGVLSSHLGPMSRVMGKRSTLDQLGDISASLDGRQDVDHVYFDMDVSGTSVNGLLENARRIQDMSTPTTGVARTAASGGAVILSAMDRAIATKGAKLGNLSVLSIVPDTSEAAKLAGRTNHIVSPDDDLKGAGFAGTAVTSEHLAMFKRLATDSKSKIVDFVAEARGKDRGAIDALGAEVFIGEAGVAAGLVDEIAANLQSVIASDNQPKEAPTMAEPTTTASDTAPPDLATVAPAAVPDSPTLDQFAAIAEMNKRMSERMDASEAAQTALAAENAALRESMATLAVDSTETTLTSLVASGRMSPSELDAQRKTISRLKPEHVQEHLDDIAARDSMATLLMADIASGTEGAFPEGLDRSLASPGARPDFAMEAKISECRTAAGDDDEKFAALVAALQGGA